MYDTLIKNVVLKETKAGRGTLSSVGILDGKIAEILTGSSAEQADARLVIDAEGNLLLPGLVDFHTHLFRHGSSFGMDADLLLSAGVTAAADMGSAGWVNFPAMYCCDLSGKKPRLRAYLNISPVGQPGRGIKEPLNDEVISLEDIRRVAEEYPGMICGLKVRLSRGIVGSLGLGPLHRAVELGDALGLPVCVHATDPPETMDRIAALLRPGDILSHTYHGQGHDSAESEAVLEGMLAARERGVLLEVGNGSKNFNFRTAEACLRQGLFPDIISSDSTPTVFHQGPAMWDLPRVMSKFLNLGMPFGDVVRAATETPARILGLDSQTGKIAPGYEADLSLFHMDPKEIIFCDSDGNTRKGPRGLVPFMTFLHGQKVWDAKAS